MPGNGESPFRPCCTLFPNDHVQQSTRAWGLTLIGSLTEVHPLSKYNLLQSSSIDWDLYLISVFEQEMESSVRADPDLPPLLKSDCNQQQQLSAAEP